MIHNHICIHTRAELEKIVSADDLDQPKFDIRKGISRDITCIDICIPLTQCDRLDYADAFTC